MNTKRPEPCPNCESKNVVWRRPRPTDTVITWAKYVVDFALGGGTADRATAIGGPGMYGDSGTSVSYTELRQRFDMKVGLKTPDLFWKCPDCKKKGEVRDLAALSGDIGLLSSMEGTISNEGGGVIGGVGGGDKA